MSAAPFIRALDWREKFTRRTVEVNGEGRNGTNYPIQDTAIPPCLPPTGGNPITRG